MNPRERHIYEFTVTELPDGRLRAIHNADPAIVVDALLWDDLELDCMVERCLRTYRLADERREREQQGAPS
jgi:hypothetical protein